MLNLKIGVLSRTNPFFSQIIKDMFPKSYFYTNINSFRKDIKKYDFIIFFNPYKNKNLLVIYNYCRDNNIKFYTVERGALPNSIFFDSTGFNYDSLSYSKDKWDYEISNDKQKKLDKYIEKETTNDNALEPQSQRLPQRELRSKLKIKEEKVIFVPLQKRDDTVIKFFCGDIKNFNNFINTINSLSSKISSEYKIIIKKHPLEASIPKLDDSIIVSHDNIKDLIELSEYIVLINSGVGVLAMMWYKPVIILGDAFYSDASLNIKAKNSDEILNILNTGFKPSKEKCNRFLSYLLHDFYSFGSFKYQFIGDERILTSIDFNILRLGKYKIENITTSSKNKKNIYFIYTNSKLFYLAQKIKKFPVMAKYLLWIKSNILKWNV